MAPPPVVAARNDFDIHNDPLCTVPAGSHRVEDVETAANRHSSPLRTLTSTNTPNCRPKPVSRVESLTAQLEKLHIGESQQVTPCKGKAVVKGKAQPGARVTRPSVTANTFVPLETVAEDEQADAPSLDLAVVSKGRPQYIELPVDRWAQHPLAVAARVSPPAAEQFEKQRNGDFDWVLTVKPPAASGSGEEKKLFFGCNLLPVLTYSDTDTSTKEEELRSYTLLATPLEGGEEPVIDHPAAHEESMALAEAPRERLAPAKTGTEPLPAVRVEECSPAVVGVGDGEDSSVPAVISMVPAREVEGIEAIDQFEEDMEAFELAAGIKTTNPPSMGVTDIRSPRVTTVPLAPVPRRDRTQAPQRERPSPGPSASKTRSDRRPSPLILLDSPKLNGEDKALAQASPRNTPRKTLASLQTLQPSVRSTKAPTVPASDLPGEAAARRLEEQREARRASQVASSPAVQDGGYKVGRRLGEKQARVPTRFAQPKPYRPQAYPAAAWTAWATDGASSERDDCSDVKSSSDDNFMEVNREHANARITPPTQTGECERAERLRRLVEIESDDDMCPTKKENDDDSKCSTENHSNEDFMELLMDRANARLTPPTVTGRRERAERLRKKESDDGLKRPSSPSRAKSMKAPTLPKFELPGEAISRRKREEHEARRKAQEEEERRRRQFKARPVGSAVAPSTVPRGTVASRSRLNGTLFEKPAQQAPPTQNKRASMVLDTQPRGRHLTTTKADQAGPHATRTTSSSVGSTGKRSSVSLEEVQQQRVRGKDVFQRDSAFSQDRTKERRERETMARIAREEAAERSRQQSREWAEKQKRKRMTIGSLRDVTTAGK